MRLALLALVGLLGGCTLPFLSFDFASRQMPGGWSITCLADSAGVRTCGAMKLADGKPFRIYYRNGEGPLLNAGTNSHPGPSGRIRVDDRPLRSLTQVAAVIDDLRTGNTAYVTYRLPDTREAASLELDVTGFDEAFIALRARL